MKTLKLFWSASMQAEMEYRMNFVLAALNSVGTVASGLFGLYLFYRKDPNALGGWSQYEALTVLGLFTILQGVTRSLLNPNLTRIVQYVFDGTLDFVLLKPLDSQFWLSLRNVAPWGIPDVILGCALLVYAGVHMDVGPWQYLWGIVPVVLAVVVLYSLWFVFAGLSIWYVKVWNATEVLRGLLEAGRFPIDAFPLGVGVFFKFVVPVAFMTTIPAQAIMGKAGANWIVAEFAIALGLFLFSRYFWRYALKYYTSASS
jgi:ABC-2 type transport system permease protein